MALMEAIPLEASDLDSLSEVIDTLAITHRIRFSLRIAPPAMF
jgi:hypothetical protein